MARDPLLISAKTAKMKPAKHMAEDSSSTKDNPRRMASTSAALQANGELQSLAAFLGVDFKGLARCLTKAVGLRKVLQCLRADDPLGCLLDAVDLDKVIDCVLEQIPNGGEFSSEFE